MRISFIVVSKFIAYPKNNFIYFYKIISFIICNKVAKDENLTEANSIIGNN
jgi:hypothetical protein